MPWGLIIISYQFFFVLTYEVAQVALQPACCSLALFRQPPRLVETFQQLGHLLLLLFLVRDLQLHGDQLRYFLLIRLCESLARPQTPVHSTTLMLIIVLKGLVCLRLSP